jgi:lipopolysaccharide export system protein LptA
MTGRLAFWAAVLTLAVAPVAAQDQHPVVQNPAQSLLRGENKDLPIQIESATLEVRDKSKIATFSGNVQVVQGDTTMKCQTLVVFYGAEDGGGAGKNAAAANEPAAGKSQAAASGQGAASGQAPASGQGAAVPQGAQDIRRIEARGGVTVVTKEQNASGDLGVYDLKAKTITLTGNVVVTQGKNVLHGDRVVVDTATGNARVESNAATAQNRVRALILPGKDANGGSTNMMSFGPQNRSN